VLTHTEIDKRLAAADLNRDRPVTPQHAQAEGALDALTGKPRREEYPPVSEDKPRDLQDREDPSLEKGKWKKLVRDMVRQVAEPVSDQQQRDGTSSRPVHDPAVPYQDRAEDDLASLPMPSTAPVDPATGKSHDLLGTMRQVKGPQDIGAGGLFTAKARMEAEPGPGTFPVPDSVSPERFRSGPVRSPEPGPPGDAHGGFSGPGQVLTTRLPGGGG